MRLASRVLLALAALPALPACGGSSSPENRPPIAHLAVSPRSVVVGDAVTLDASASSDPDGRIVLYRFIVPGSDEIDAPSPLVQHRFAAPGRVRVGLVVVDQAGAEARDDRASDEAVVSVMPEPPPPCRSDADCDPGDVCRSGECRPPPCGPSRPCSPPLVCRMDECVPP